MDSLEVVYSYTFTKTERNDAAALGMIKWYEGVHVMDMKQSTIEQQRLDQARLEANGMYSSQFEKDACGMGFVVNIKGKKSHDIIDDGLRI